MSDMIVGVLVPEHTPGIAAKVQGRPDLSRSAVGRISYRVGKGMPVKDAIALETPETNSRGGMLNFRADRSDIDENDGNRSFIVRKGLALMMGMTEKQAEVWAELPIGRPKKDKDNSA